MLRIELWCDTEGLLLHVNYIREVEGLAVNAYDCRQLGHQLRFRVSSEDQAVKSEFYIPVTEPAH